MRHTFRLFSFLDFTSTTAFPRLFSRIINKAEQISVFPTLYTTYHQPNVPFETGSMSEVYKSTSD